jgi:hypothetical protein
MIRVPSRHVAGKTEFEIAHGSETNGSGIKGRIIVLIRRSPLTLPLSPSAGERAG